MEELSEAIRAVKGLMGAFTRERTHETRRLGDVAPLVRRPAEIDVSREYPVVSVRSFGRGTFHKPPLLGSEITWEKPHLVKAGDILISNIKAWEGAIAVAGPEDDGRFGSHRYLTCVPNLDVVTARYLCFYLLSPDGLRQVRAASPGSADRNRTLSAKALQDIRIPVPPLEDQRAFDVIFDAVARLQHIQSEAVSSNEQLMPAMFLWAFPPAPVLDAERTSGPVS